MPEFRFRRKKKKQASSRRHTVHDTEEAHAQVAAVRERVRGEAAAGATNVRTRSPSIGDPNDIPEPVPMAALTDGGHIVSTGTLAREREKFFDLLRTKYPEHGEGIEDFLSTDDTALDKQRRGCHSRSQSVDIETMLSMQVTSGEEEEEEGGRERGRRGTEREGRRRRDSFSPSDAKEVCSEPETAVHRHYGGCLFLRHGEELRRCPMPSPVTLSTLKNLLVNTFDLQTCLLDDPTSYVMIQDRGSVRWRKLTNISEVYDHCILQLADPEALGANPTHFITTETMLEDHTYSSSESPPPLITSHHHHSPPPPSHPHYNHSSHLATPLRSPGTQQPMDSSRDCTVTSNTTNKSTWHSDTAATAPLSPPHISALPPPPPHPSLTTTSAPVQFGSPHSVTSSTSGVCSESLQMSISPLTISRHVRVVEHRVEELRQDFETFRREQQSELSEFALTLRGTSHKIMAAIRGHARIAALGRGVSVEPFRRERLELTEEKNAYRKHADDAVLEVSILESAVEDIRRDVVERRCRVHEREVDGLVDAVQKTVQAISFAKDQYHPLDAKMKRVMEKELTDIVEEEKFIQDEFPRLEEAGGKCLRLTGMLETLKQVAVVQFHRTPLVPYFAPVTKPDRQALMENIKAVTPNHAHRVESIEMAKCVQHKKKELVMRRQGIKRFESQLRIQREHLHKMETTSELEDRQAKRVIQLYLEEKAEREAELAREMKLERKVAERKRKEERERLKERLQRQRRDEKKMQRQKQDGKKKMGRQKEEERMRKQREKVVERLKSRGEGEQGSSQSVAGEEENGEWYHQEIEEGSIHFSSSFSSTASLLEHVRNLGGWSSDNNSLQDNSTTAISERQRTTATSEREKTTATSEREKTTATSERQRTTATSEREKNTATSERQRTTATSEREKTTATSEREKTTATSERQRITAPKENESTVRKEERHTSTEVVSHDQERRNDRFSERESSTLEETSGAEKAQNHSEFTPKPQQKQSSNNGRGKDLLQLPSGKSHKSPKKKKVPTETRLPVSSGAASSGLKSKQQKSQSLPRDQPPMSKYESSGLKTNTTQLQRLNNETRRTQSPTLTGLQSVLKTNHTRSPLPHKQTNQTTRSRITPQAAGKAATKLQRLNDFATSSPPARRVASSDALLDDHRHQQSHNGPTNTPITTAVASQLANTPPKIRKSIGYMGEFENQAAIYDLLEKKSEKKQQAKKDNRLEKGFQTPTFDPRVRLDNDLELQGSELVSPHANSQPENFEFMSNPSYESRAEAQQNARTEAKPQAKAKSRSLARSDPVTKQNGHVSTSNGGVAQSHKPISQLPKAVVVDTSVLCNTKMQSLHGSNRGWQQNSESDSSETGRVRSVLSDYSSVTQSSVTHQSILSAGHQSNSSGGFSSGSRSDALPTSIKLHSHVTSRPPWPHPHQGESHSGLPVPRKQYHSHPLGDETERSRSRQLVAPHPPPHRQTTQVPMQTVHNEAPLTSYPRFQSREDHKTRLHAAAAGSQLSRRHRTTRHHQLGVLPGTGQLAHVAKPHPDHAHLLHPAKNKHPDRASSLV